MGRGEGASRLTDIEKIQGANPCVPTNTMNIESNVPVSAQIGTVVYFCSICHYTISEDGVCDNCGNCDTGEEKNFDSSSKLCYDIDIKMAKDL